MELEEEFIRIGIGLSKSYSYMGGKDLSYIFRSSSISYLSACNSLAHKPVTSKESSRSSVQWVPIHRALLDGPFGEYHQSAAKNATVIEFPIRQYMSRLSADCLVVFLGPTFLQSDNLWDWVCCGYASADFC